MKTQVELKHIEGNWLRRFFCRIGLHAWSAWHSTKANADGTVYSQSKTCFACHRTKTR